MSEEFASFNDPALRTAVRKVWGAEQAPFELRQRIAALVPSQARAKGPQRQHEPLILRLRSPLYGLAAAASVLLAIGLVLHDWTSGGRAARIAPRAIALPDPSAAALFASHDQWAKSPRHHIKGSLDGNLSEVRQRLRKDVGFPVLAANLHGSWKFEGALVSTIGKSKSAQLFFDSGDSQCISIFSLPAGFLSGSAPGCDYCQANDKHSMAGFATGNGFYCVVGSSGPGAMSLEEVRSIRDELRPAMNQPTIAAALAAILR
jgi:hypothetical protein